MSEFPPVLPDYQPMQVSLDHLKRITDGRGVIQHCICSTPNRETGFCVDDNARALIVAVMHLEQFGEAKVLELARTYLRFLCFAQKENGRFHNFVDCQGVFLDEEGSEDSFGRAVWACGYALSSPALDEELRVSAQAMFLKAFPQILTMEALRAQAFSVLGLYNFLQAFPQDSAAHEVLLALSERLMRAYQLARAGSWHWFEQKLTYCNARLPQALYLAYQMTKKERFLDAAERTTRFLLENLVPDGVLLVVGNQGWYSRGGELSLYDQQPVDAGCMVELMATAYEVTGQKKYLDLAKLSFAWFGGKNSSGQIMCDPQSGACHDGLEEKGVNLNQGAESTLSYLLAALTMRKLLSRAENGSKVKSKSFFDTGSRIHNS